MADVPTLDSATAADLKARYPVFADQTDAYVDLILNEARGSVNATWIVSDQVPALLALAAHLIATERYGTGLMDTGSSMGKVAVTGPLEQIDVGDTKVKFAHKFASEEGQAGGSGSQAGLLSTAYGRRYLELYRRSFPAVMVV